MVERDDERESEEERRQEARERDEQDKRDREAANAEAERQYNYIMDNKGYMEGKYS